MISITYKPKIWSQRRIFVVYKNVTCIVVDNRIIQTPVDCGRHQFLQSFYRIKRMLLLKFFNLVTQFL